MVSSCEDCSILRSELMDLRKILQEWFALVVKRFDKQDSTLSALVNSFQSQLSIDTNGGVVGVESPMSSNDPEIACPTFLNRSEPTLTGPGKSKAASETFRSSEISIATGDRKRRRKGEPHKAITFLHTESMASKNTSDILCATTKTCTKSFTDNTEISFTDNYYKPPAVMVSSNSGRQIDHPSDNSGICALNLMPKSICDISSDSRSAIVDTMDDDGEELGGYYENTIVQQYKDEIYVEADFSPSAASHSDSSPDSQPLPPIANAGSTTDSNTKPVIEGDRVIPNFRATRPRSNHTKHEIPDIKPKRETESPSYEQTLAGVSGLAEGAYLDDDPNASQNLRYRAYEHIVRGDQRSFTCDLCSFTSQYKHVVERHILCKHLCVQYVCKACGKIFKSKDWYRRHEEFCYNAPSTPIVVALKDL